MGLDVRVGKDHCGLRYRAVGEGGKCWAMSGIWKPNASYKPPWYEVLAVRRPAARMSGSMAGLQRLNQMVGGLGSICRPRTQIKVGCVLRASPFSGRYPRSSCDTGRNALLIRRVPDSWL